MREHPEVVRRLKQAFDDYWKRVTPNDRDRVTFVVGHPHDPEVFLQSMDWYLPAVPWNHQQTSQGAKQSGTWLISAAEKGTYQFEVRRWPSEVDAPISGIPAMDKVVDAWDARGGKPYLIYADGKSPFRALSVAYIRLKVGDWESVQEVGNGDTRITFNVPLDHADYEVKADMLDARKEVIAGAYYVYCTKMKEADVMPADQRKSGIREQSDSARRGER